MIELVKAGDYTMQCQQIHKQSVSDGTFMQKKNDSAIFYGN